MRKTSINQQWDTKACFMRGAGFPNSLVHKRACVLSQVDAQR